MIPGSRVRHSAVGTSWMVTARRSSPMSQGNAMIASRLFSVCSVVGALSAGCAIPSSASGPSPSSQCDIRQDSLTVLSKGRSLWDFLHLTFGDPHLAGPGTGEKLRCRRMRVNLSSAAARPSAPVNGRLELLDPPTAAGDTSGAKRGRTGELAFFVRPARYNQRYCTKRFVICCPDCHCSVGY